MSPVTRRKHVPNRIGNRELSSFQEQFSPALRQVRLATLARVSEKRSRLKDRLGLPKPGLRSPKLAETRPTRELRPGFCAFRRSYARSLELMG